MSSPTAADVLGRVTLVTGPEELLADRTVTQVQDAVRAADAEADLSATTGDRVTPDVLADLASPSLFSSSRCVVVRAVQDLPEAGVDGVLGYAAAPADDVALVLVHNGGNKGKRLLDRLRKQAAVVEVKTAAPKPSELPSFVNAEVRSYGGRIAQDAAGLLVQAVGSDLRSLAAASQQLAYDSGGGPVTADLVRRYFGGRAEVKSFAVADAALAGRSAPALEELRWALDNGVAHVLVTSAFASGLRSLGRYRAAGGRSNADLAREVGVPPWKLRTLKRQARGWTDAGVARAIRAVAAADADVKGAAGDPDYALERMVLTVAGAHGG